MANNEGVFGPDRGKIDCIIVKDLSRLGRNYIETGKYLERVFPALGVRFISINDNYDSLEEKSDADQIVIPFKNLINDAYCRDISIKIRSQLDVKRKDGKFIGSFASYGYKKDPKDKNHLIVDDFAAEIVKSIFSWKLEGYSNGRIAERLNSIGVLTPMEYKRSCGFNFKSGFRLREVPKWSPQMVGRILARPGLWNQDWLTAERDKYGANDIKPGLTGWAQINGRDELEIPDKAKLDGDYVKNFGLKMDIKCFLGSLV